MASASQPTPTGRETALVALGQGATMISGGVLALLIAQLFGKGPETDAFFAAYGVYALGITFTYSFRLTAISRLVTGGADAITSQLGAVVVMALGLALPMVVLAVPLGSVLVESDPTGAAPDALRVLWIALAGQLLAAMLAAVLTVRGAFRVIALAMLLASLVSLGSFVAAEGALGVQAAAVGLAIAGVLLAAVLGAALLRSGWRPRAANLTVVQEASRLTFASAIFFSTALAYVVCVAVAAREGTGEATLFAYAYVLAVILLGLTTNVTAMVHSPAVVASDRRTDEAAELGMWSLRFTVILTAPVLAMALLVGRPVLGFVLGPDFRGAAATAIVVTLLALTGWLLATAVGTFAIVELLARGELRLLALVGAGQLAAVAGAAPAGAALAGIEGIAAALSLVTLVATGVLLRAAFGARWRGVAADAAQTGGRGLAVAGVALGPAIALLAVLGRETEILVAGGVLAAALCAGATYVAWPHESRALAALLHRSAGR